jgi:hypothetical protein
MPWRPDAHLPADCPAPVAAHHPRRQARPRAGSAAHVQLVLHGLAVFGLDGGQQLAHIQRIAIRAGPVQLIRLECGVRTAPEGFDAPGLDGQRTATAIAGSIQRGDGVIGTRPALQWHGKLVHLVIHGKPQQLTGNWHAVADAGAGAKPATVVVIHLHCPGHQFVLLQAVYIIADLVFGAHTHNAGQQQYPAQNQARSSQCRQFCRFHLPPFMPWLVSCSMNHAWRIVNNLKKTNKQTIHDE